MTGQTISHYKILAKLGEGGMGVVYKAEDTKLDRIVALKFLAPHLVQDEEGRKRFIREAKAAAALDHPNICTIHEIDEVEGQTFIAMAFVEGRSVKDKIAERPLKLEDALDIAIQTAQGLQAAHEKGIVHRDIKPANIMLTAKGGPIKVMDFGLAHLAGQSRLTKTDTTLGTVAYMSPEQAQGQDADHRADVWSLGVVVYEMVTGQLPFKGDYDQVVAYNILNEDPEPMTAQRAGVPMELEWIVTKALAKAPEERYQHVEEMIVDLKSLSKKLASGKSTILQAAPGRVEVGSRRSIPLQQSALPLAPSEVVVPKRKLRLQQPRELDGTEGASRPFWSPDSQFLGFATTRELKKVSLQGGPAITLCPLPRANFSGGGWSPNGDLIAFASEVPPRIYEVPARGGEPKLLFKPEGSTNGATSPHFLPLQAGALSILFDTGSQSDRDIAVKNLETGEWELLAEGANPVYSPSGHIVYQTNRYESGLWALPFSIETLQPTGEAFPIAENVGEPSVAADGTLVYVDFFGVGQQQLVWRDREGKKLGVIGRPQQEIRHPALSPDGRRVAVRGMEEGNRDVWLHEVERALRRRLTFDPALDSRPVWSPSGEQITFLSGRQGNFDIFSRPADGTGEPVLLAGTDLDEFPYDWSSDGNYLLYTVTDPENGLDLWYLKRKEDGSGFESVPFLQTSFNEVRPNISPGGRFVAYCSDESGQYEVHVQPFPEGSGKWQVSTNGGDQPRWSKDGKELFYVEGDTLKAVVVRTTPSFSSGSATSLFKDPNLVAVGPYRIDYDVSADSQRFVLVATLESKEAKAPSVHVVQNWFAEFRDRQQE